jgi:hypothetical protein
MQTDAPPNLIARSQKIASKTRGRGAGRPFAKGNSGPPKGARHKATIAAEVLLDGEATALTRKAVEMALTGDTTPLRLCLDQYCHRVASGR